MLWLTASHADLREELDGKELWFMPESETSQAENGKEKLKAKFFKVFQVLIVQQQ